MRFILLNKLLLLSILMVKGNKFVCRKLKNSQTFPNQECMDQTVFLKGPKNDFGDKGMKGEVGRKGENGEKGKKGINQKKGLKGSKGLKGNAGQKTLNITSDPGCSGVTFHFPRDKQTDDYVRYLPYFSTTKSATVCAWIEKDQVSIDGEPQSYGNFISILSYYVNYDNLVIGISSTQKIYFRMKIKDEYLKIDTFPESQKFHLCLRLRSNDNKVDLYINAVQRDEKDYDLETIPGGGTLIIGQELDSTIGSIEQNHQAFRGNITNLMMWPRVLSNQEIRNIAEQCICPQDYSLAMTMDRSELNGEAYYTNPDSCPTI